MMQDLSMYILDIATNSIKAKANNIGINLFMSTKENKVILEFHDDGCGMDEQTVLKVCDPFFTTRTTRKVGLGVAFLKSLAESCNGQFEISSIVNKGTTIKLSYEANHWDAPPLGNISESIVTLIQSNKEIDYQFHFKHNQKEFLFDTKEIKETLEDVDICEPTILMWLKEYIAQSIEI